MRDVNRARRLQSPRSTRGCSGLEKCWKGAGKVIREPAS